MFGFITGNGCAAIWVPNRGLLFALEFVPEHNKNVEQLEGLFLCIPKTFTLDDGIILVWVNLLLSIVFYKVNAL